MMVLILVQYSNVRVLAGGRGGRGAASVQRENAAQPVQLHGARRADVQQPSACMLFVACSNAARELMCGINANANDRSAAQWRSRRRAWPSQAACRSGRYTTRTWRTSSATCVHLRALSLSSRVLSNARLRLRLCTLCSKRRRRRRRWPPRRTRRRRSAPWTPSTRCVALRVSVSVSALSRLSWTVCG